MADKEYRGIKVFQNRKLYLNLQSIFRIGGRGDNLSPLFITMSTLINKAKIYLDQALEENPQLFVVSFDVNAANHIKVVIDGDQDVSISDCMAVSRKIEHQLDRDEEDFSVEVLSFGVGEKLMFPRQFIKNVGRKLEVETADEKIKADLVEATEDGIELQWKAREPKPVGKGKHTVEKELKLAYQEIKQAKVMIIFNK